MESVQQEKGVGAGRRGVVPEAGGESLREGRVKGVSRACPGGAGRAVRRKVWPPIRLHWSSAELEKP